MTPARLLAIAPVVGFVVGVLTQIGQSVLPDGFRQIANSISPWVTVAFALGAVAPRPRWAAVAGFLALVPALVGYYFMIWIRFGYVGGTGSLVLWSVGAMAGGLVFGPAGWYWRHTTGLPRIAAISLLAAVYIAEGAYLVLILPEPAVGVGFALTGLAVPLLIGSSWRERGYAWLGVIPCLFLAGLGYAALYVLSSLVATI